MVASISGKWATDTTNLPEGDLRAPKPHLQRGLPNILRNPNSAAPISGGWYPHRETTKSGLRMSVKVWGEDGSERSRKIANSRRVFIARYGADQPAVYTATKYYPLGDPDGWGDHLLVVTPNADVAPDEDLGGPSFPAHTILGWGGWGDRWINDLRRNRQLDSTVMIFHIGAFSGLAETTPYPTVAATSLLLIDKTSEIINVAAE